jgi:peroxiredoxin
VDESPRHVTAFYDEVRIEYPSVMSTERAEQAFGGVVGLPTTFVLDRDGRIATSYVGDTDPATVERDVQALLAN